MFKWLAKKVEPYLVRPPEIKVEFPLAPPVQIHDAVIIRPGDLITLFEKTVTSNFSWLVFDFSDFGFGTLTIKVELLFAGTDDYILYYSRALSSDEIERQAWDLQLPPSEGIRVHIGLTSGRNTRIAYHFYSFVYVGPVGI